MAGVKGTKRLTEEEFKNIKALCVAGIPESVVAKATKRSPHLVYEVAQSDSFLGYKELTRARLAATRAKSEARASAEELPSFDHPIFSNIPEIENRVPEVDKDTQKLLNRLDNIQLALNRLVELEEARQGVEKVNTWRFGRSR
jgi:hypothetical protein